MGNFNYKIDDRVPPEVCLRMLTNFRKSIKDAEERFIQEQPFLDFLKTKYEHIDYFSFDKIKKRVIIEFDGYEGEIEARDFFKRLIAHELFDEQVEYRLYEDDCYGGYSYEIDVIGVKNFDQIKELFE